MVRVDPRTRTLLFVVGLILFVVTGIVGWLRRRA
jgi:hypothetical protein